MYYIPFLSPKKPKRDVSSATKTEDTNTPPHQSEASPTFSTHQRETPSEEDKAPDSPLSGSWLDLSTESATYTLGSHQTSLFPQDAQDSKPHRPLSITRKPSCSSSTYEILSNSAIQHEMDLDAVEAARQHDLELQKMMEEEEFLRKDAEARAAIREQDRIQREKDLEGGMCGYERNCPFGDDTYFEDLIVSEDGNLRKRTESEAREHEATQAKKAAERERNEREVEERLAREAAKVEERERASRIRIAEQVREAAQEHVCAGAACGCREIEKIREMGDTYVEEQIKGLNGDGIKGYSPTLENASPRPSTKSSSSSCHSNRSDEQGEVSPFKVPHTEPAPNAPTTATSPLQKTITRVMGMKTTSLVKFFETKEKEKDK